MEITIYKNIIIFLLFVILISCDNSPYSSNDMELTEIFPKEGQISVSVFAKPYFEFSSDIALGNLQTGVFDASYLFNKKVIGRKIYLLPVLNNLKPNSSNYIEIISVVNTDGELTNIGEKVFFTTASIENEPNNNIIEADTVLNSMIIDGEINSAIDADRFLILLDSAKQKASFEISLLDTLPILISLKSDSLFNFFDSVNTMDTSIELNPRNLSTISLYYKANMNVSISSIPVGGIYRISN